MAFSFGGASGTPAFGAPSSTPAFGAPSSASGFSFGPTPAFGASSTQAFGAASSAPAFGASSTPAFGAAATSTPAFGAASTPAFGGASSTPSFNFSTTSTFGQTTAQSAAAPSFGGFGQPQQPAQQAVPFTHATKFEELDKATQDKLTQIQEQISKYEADRQLVMQLEHLQDNTALQQGLDADTSSLSAELRQLQATIKAEQEGLSDFREKAIRLLKSTETVVRTFERTKLWREAPQYYQRNEPLKPAQQELLAQPVVLPGPFLDEAVAGFSANCAEYSRCLEEVEQVLNASNMAEAPAGVNWVTALPTIVANMHDYFVAVAAKLERTHAEVQKAKSAYLARLRARGITVDPFERAHRQEQLQLQQQQQRSAAAAAAAGPGGQASLAALPAAGVGGTAGALVPAAASPQTGGLFGAAATPATPAGAPAGFGAAPFGSPFVSTATPFGAAANGGLSRSTSKGRSGKKR